jgi:hypothetical protein
MEEVSRMSGVQVRWLSGQPEEKRVSVEFTALPLPEALERILVGTNFLLFYASVGEGTTLTQLWISSKPIPSSVSQGEDAAKTKEEGNSPPVDVLIQTAVSRQETAVRVEAVARLGEHASTDSKVEAILSRLASDDDNPQVRAAAAEVLAGAAE